MFDGAASIGKRVAFLDRASPLWSANLQFGSRFRGIRRVGRREWEVFRCPPAYSVLNLFMSGMAPSRPRPCLLLDEGCECTWVYVCICIWRCNTWLYSDAIGLWCTSTFFYLYELYWDWLDFATSINGKTSLKVENREKSMRLLTRKLHPQHPDLRGHPTDSYWLVLNEWIDD